MLLLLAPGRLIKLAEKVHVILMLSRLWLGGMRKVPEGVRGGLLLKLGWLWLLLGEAIEHVK